MAKFFSVHNPIATSCSVPFQFHLSVASLLIDLSFIIDRLQKWVCNSWSSCWSYIFKFTWTCGSLLWYDQLRGLFYRYNSGIYSNELAKLVTLPLICTRSSRSANKLHDLAVSIPRYCKEPYTNTFFLLLARLGIFLPTNCFPVTYNLHCF